MDGRGATDAADFVMLTGPPGRLELDRNRRGPQFRKHCCEFVALRQVSSMARLPVPWRLNCGDARHLARDHMTAAIARSHVDHRTGT